MLRNTDLSSAESQQTQEDHEETSFLYRNGASQTNLRRNIATKRRLWLEGILLQPEVVQNLVGRGRKRGKIFASGTMCILSILKSM